MKHVLLCMFALFALLVSSGCMKMGPDFHRPDTGIHIPTTFQYAPTEAVTPLPEDRWWEVFNDPVLNEIVEEATQ